MRHTELTELRREHERNVAAVPRYNNGHAEAVRLLKGVGNLENFGITMTSLPKVGINPRSTYDTPIGIYYYPATYYLKVKSSGQMLPFADHANYINIIQLTNYNGLMLSELDENDRAQLLNTLKKRIPEYLKMSEKEQRQFGLLMDEYIAAGDREGPYYDMNTGKSGPGARFWFTLDVLSKKYSPKHPTVFWNRMIQLLGFDYVEDDGAGIIYSSEPVQGIIVSPHSFKVVHRVKNLAIDRIKTFIYHGYKLSEPLQMKAVKKNVANFVAILDNKIIPSEAVQWEAIKTSPWSLVYLFNAGIIPSPEIQVQAVTQNENLIASLLTNDYKVCDEALLAAIKKDGSIISDLLNHKIRPTPDMIRAAVAYDPQLLRVVSPWASEELLKELVSRNPYLIRNVLYPSEEVQLAAIHRDPKVIEFIKNPSEAVKQLVNQKTSRKR